jgi:hypothetical protein
MRQSLQHLSCQIASSGGAMLSRFTPARHGEPTVRALRSASEGRGSRVRLGEVINIRDIVTFQGQSKGGMPLRY